MAVLAVLTVLMVVEVVDAAGAVTVGGDAAADDVSTTDVGDVAAESRLLMLSPGETRSVNREIYHAM